MNVKVILFKAIIFILYNNICYESDNINNKYYYTDAQLAEMENKYSKEAFNLLINMHHAYIELINENKKIREKNQELIKELDKLKNDPEKKMRKIKMLQEECYKAQNTYSCESDRVLLLKNLIIQAYKELE